MIYFDTPRWPNHGTLWGHLISDHSLDELHDAASRAGLPGRAFDLDHYDWPAEYQTAIEGTGATHVDSATLVRILHASGLRILMRERAAERWQRTQRALDALNAPPRAMFTIRGKVCMVQVLDLVLGPISHAESAPLDGSWPKGILPEARFALPRCVTSEARANTQQFFARARCEQPGEAHIELTARPRARSQHEEQARNAAEKFVQQLSAENIEPFTGQALLLVSMAEPAST